MSAELDVKIGKSEMRKCLEEEENFREQRVEGERETEKGLCGCYIKGKDTRNSVCAKLRERAWGFLLFSLLSMAQLN